MRAAGRLSILSLCLTLVLSAMFLSGQLPARAAPRRSLSDSLIAYWKLDETSGNRVDELTGCGGSGCTLTDHNTVTNATGKVGGAAQFTAANIERLTRSSHANLQVGNIDFTVAVWAYLDSKPSGTFEGRRLAGQYDYGVNGRAWGVYYSADSDRFEFVVSSDGTSGGVKTVTANNLGSPSLSTWYFVVVWHDATNDTINIQVNNGTPNSAAHSAGVLTSGSTWGLGTFHNSGSPESSNHVMDGRLDEFGFWKRVLTDEERAMLYNSGNGCTYPFTACEATPTPTPSNTPTPTPSNTPTPTDTPGPTATDTPEPTDTHTPGPTATDTPEPTDTHTPGPDYWIDVPLSSGNILRVERRWSYGELFIGVAILILVMVLVGRGIYDVAGRWF